MGLGKGNRRWFASALVVVLGLVTGVSTAAWSTATAGPTAAELHAVFDVTHLPPLLTAAGEDVTLAYDVHCAPHGVESADAGCDARGALFVRTLGERAFAEFPLERGQPAGGARLAIRLPRRLTSLGVEYYAAIEAPELGERVLVPAGGATAPHVSRPLEARIDIQLGTHVFGRDRRTGTRVAYARWGDGRDEAGLEPGRTLAPIGASAFDVDPRGDVVILDHVNRRLLRWNPGSGKPTPVPVSVNGTLADLALAADGSVYVLETTAPPGRNPLVRRFDDDGRELEAVESSERSPSQIRIDGRGPVVLGRPSHHWMPVMIGGVPASPRKQLEHGRPGRRYAGGKEVVVLRHENELRVAVVAGREVTRSWRLLSRTALAEVQLVEPWGQRLVVVARAYDHTADEFVVLVLDRSGLVDRFTLDSADWAEASPFGRFRLVGGSLYRLGSSPLGVFVDRFDLEVR